MTLKNKIFFQIFICFLYSGPVYNQESSGNKPALFVENKEYSLPLKFQSIWKDYLIFYDIQSGLDKQIYYLQYRIDRWDYSNDIKANELVSGQEYDIRFIFLKSIINESELINKKDNNSETFEKKEIRKVKNIIRGKYLGHSQIQIKNIRF